MKANLTCILVLTVFSTKAQVLPGSLKDSSKVFIVDQQKVNSEAINKPFPAFSFLYNGRIIDNNYLKGKTVFINFWIEDCAPCIAEFSAFNEMYNKLKGDENFEFISFTIENEQKVAELKSKYQIQYKIFSIKWEECARLGGNGFPISIIIDSRGLIRYQIFGGSSNEDQARMFVMNTIYPLIMKQF